MDRIEIHVNFDLKKFAYKEALIVEGGKTFYWCGKVMHIGMNTFPPSAMQA